MSRQPPNPPSNPAPAGAASERDSEAFGSGASSGAPSGIGAASEVPPTEDPGWFEEDFSDIGSEPGASEEDGRGVAAAAHETVDAVTDFVDDIVDDLTDLVD